MIVCRGIFWIKKYDKKHFIIPFLNGFTFLLAVIAGRLLMIGVVAHRDAYFSCDAKVVVVNGVSNLSLATSYFFEGDKGLVVFKGRMQQGEKSIM